MPIKPSKKKKIICAAANELANAFPAQLKL